jgi:glycosyltransferase involved in cell wall biosynthesis
MVNSNTKITAVIPTKNESTCIGKLIDCLNEYVDEVIVVDGNSSDKTCEIAENHGAELFKGEGGGKGHDLRLFQKSVQNRKHDSDIFVMLDGDMSYHPEELPSLVRPIKDNKADVVIGSRFDKIKPEPGSTRSFNKFGNHLLTCMARFLYQRNDVTDITSGYWAFSKDFLMNANLTAEGWDLETNLFTNAANDYRFEVVPIKYRPREGYSKCSLLHAYRFPIYLFKYFTTEFLRGKNDKRT